jgi:arylsulfatase A-like enzyme
MRASTLRLLTLALACASCAPDTAPVRGANVVVVLVDALRADHLGCYGYALPTSPFLDELARDGVVFERAVSAASQTVPSVLSLWASVYPSRHGNQYFARKNAFRVGPNRTRPRVPEQLPLMAEMFQRRGYATGAVIGNALLHPDYGFARGFDRYLNLPAQQRLNVLPRGQDVNRAAFTLLEEWRERPFLLYLHYMDVHSPYQPPEPYRREFVGSLRGMYSYVNGLFPILRPEDVAFTRALYDAGIRGVDDVVHELVVALRSNGLADSTLLVVTADHGDEFHEHGGMGHGWTLYQEVLHVPLVFVHPRLTRAATARRFPGPVSLVDVLPTLLELTGGEVLSGLDGVSLAPLIVGAEAEGENPPRALFSELGDMKAIQKGERKLIRSMRQGEHDEAFDLQADPREQQPGAPAWRQELATELSAFLEHAPPPLPAPAEDAPVDPRLEEQLRALGYAE